MIGTAAAILGASLIGGAASVGGSLLASNAQNKAAKQAIAYQQQVRAENTANLSPWMQSGQGANNLLSSFYGLNGDTALGDNALARFRESPDYKFALQEGMAGLENSAAAKGGLLGGNQIRRTVEFGQGLASNNLGNYLNRISGISQQGLGAASTLAGSNLQSAGQVGSSYGNLGQAQASGYVGAANGINGAMNNLLMYNQLGQSSFGGGSFSGNGAMAASGGTNLGAWY